MFGCYVDMNILKVTLICQPVQLDSCIRRPFLIGWLTTRYISTAMQSVQLNSTNTQQLRSIQRYLPRILHK